MDRDGDEFTHSHRDGELCGAALQLYAEASSRPPPATVGARRSALSTPEPPTTPRRRTGIGSGRGGHERTSATAVPLPRCSAARHRTLGRRTVPGARLVGKERDRAQGVDPAQDRPVVLDDLDAEPDRGPPRFAARRARPSRPRAVSRRRLRRAGQEQPAGDRGRQAAGRRGCGRYAVGPGPVWDEADRRSYAAWQRRLGYNGGSADGIPGRADWDRLRVPRM